jgi:uncharacterized membrane protein
VIDDQITAVIIGLIVISSGVAAVQPYWNQRVPVSFNEFAVLGPNMTFAGYPQNVTVGQAFTLYLFIGNFEGLSQYYQVLAKAGNLMGVINTTNPYEGPVIAQYQVILQNGQNVTHPITISMPSAGNSQRLVFELWNCSETGDFAYTGRWVQLYMDVAPGSS